MLKSEKKPEIKRESEVRSCQAGRTCCSETYAISSEVCGPISRFPRAGDFLPGCVQGQSSSSLASWVFGFFFVFFFVRKVSRSVKRPWSHMHFVWRACWPFRSQARQQLLRDLINTWRDAACCLLVLLSNSTRWKANHSICSFKKDYISYLYRKTKPEWNSVRIVIRLCRFYIYTPDKGVVASAFNGLFLFLVFFFMWNRQRHFLFIYLFTHSSTAA